MNTWHRIPILGLLSLLLAGCAAPSLRPDATAPYATAELQALRAEARHPRLFYMDVYRTESGEPAFTNAFRVYDEAIVELPFESPGSSLIPLIALVGPRERRIVALTDSSAPLSWAPMDRRRALGLELLGPELFLQTPTHVPDDATGAAAVLSELYFGRLRMEMALVYARAVRGSLWPLTRDPRAAEADLVLGADALRAFAWVQWDFPARRLVIGHGAAYAGPEESRLAAVPLQKREGPLIVMGEMEGRAVPIVLDVAGDFELAMDRPAGEIVRQLTIGDVIFRRLDVVAPATVGVASEPARLGRRALAPYRLTLDNRRRMVYLERPTAPRTPAPPMHDEDMLDDLDDLP